MGRISDTINWYGRTYPTLDRAGEESVLSGDDSRNMLVNHSVYHVIRGLVLAGKKIDSTTLPHVMGGLVDAVDRWIASDREKTCSEFLLSEAVDNYTKWTGDGLLVWNPMFKSIDAPIGNNANSKEKDSSSFLGFVNSRIDPDYAVEEDWRDGIEPDRVYDTVLDAWIDIAKISDREEKVSVEKEDVDAGIYSYSNEIREQQERKAQYGERLGYAKSSMIEDRIVKPTKARLRKIPKRFIGMRDPKEFKPGSSATLLPHPSRGSKYHDVAAFDFNVNRHVTRKFPEKCLSCIHLQACSSWGTRYFSFGIHGPLACNGPMIEHGGHAHEKR